MAQKSISGMKRSQIKNELGITPGLAVILVGEDAASHVYVRNKGKQTKEVGMNSFEHKLDENSSEEKLLTLINDLNNDPKVHGILCQLPLPNHINEEKILLSTHDESYKAYYESTPRLLRNIFKYKKTKSTDMIEIRIKRIIKRLWEVIGYLFLFTLLDFFYFVGL